MTQENANAHADSDVAKHVPDLSLDKLSLICCYGHTVHWGKP